MPTTHTDDPSAVGPPTGRADVMTALLDATRQLLQTRPPNDVDVRAVAALAGVNHGLAHRHFGSKAALFSALHQRLAGEIIVQLDDGLASNGDLMEQLVLPFDVVTGTPEFGQLLAWTSAAGATRAELMPTYRLVQRSRDLLRDEGVAPREADGVVALLAAAALGWSAFGPLLASGFAEDADAEVTLRADVVATARRLVAETTRHV